MLKEKINNLFNPNGENNKRKIENLVVFIIILIITILVINMVWGNNSKKEVTESTYTKLAEKESNIISNKIDVGEYNLEQNLEDILSKISGARKG